MDRIYLSYRRPYNTAIAGRIYDRLAVTFGSSGIVRSGDVMDTGHGGDRALREAVRQCSAMVVVMGQGWEDLQDNRGTSLLESREDTVRLEIEAALQHDLRVLPILVDGYHMPRRDQLPDSIADLTGKNALELESGRRFDDDMRRIVTALAAWVSTERDITSPVALAQSLLGPPVVARPPRSGDLRRVETGHLFLLICEVLVLSAGLAISTTMYVQAALPGVVVCGTFSTLLIILLALPEWRLIASLLCAAGLAFCVYLASDTMSARVHTLHPDSQFAGLLPYVGAVGVFLLVAAINYSLYRRSSKWRRIVLNAAPSKDDKAIERTVMK